MGSAKFCRIGGIDAECTNDFVSLPLCKPFREAAECGDCVSNGFHNSLRLLSIAQQLELKQNHLYILLVFPDLYVLVCVQCNERKAVALAH